MRLDHLLSMENISYGDRVTDDLQLRSRAKTKKAMRSVQAKAYEYGSRSCSILNDRLKKNTSDMGV